MLADVRFGSLADIPGLPRDVWYGSVSDRNSRLGEGANLLQPRVTLETLWSAKPVMANKPTHPAPNAAAAGSGTAATVWSNARHPKQRRQATSPAWISLGFPAQSSRNRSRFAQRAIAPT